ncbi:MAG TPA: GAF domain-containing protein, partial [Ardenticatenaceae bacterium]|nr:GAF domain-containing protein [Ardenticatenaceae bacterium]
ALAQQLPQTTVVLLLPNLSESSLRGVLSGQRQPHRGYGLIALLPGADELLGVFVVESATLMTAELAQVLALLAANVAAAVQNARHYRQEQRRALQLQTIAAVSRRVAAILDLDELLDQVVDLVKESFGYYHVQVYLVDREREEVVFRAGSGPVGDALAHHPPRFPVEDDEPGIIAWVASHAEPLLVNDVTTEPRYIRDDERLLPNTRAELAVPLKVETRVLGVLDVQSDQAGTFTSDDLFIVSTLADQVAIAIEDARLYAAQREETWVTTALLQVAEAVSTLTRLADVLETVARITPILTGASSTAVFLWREEENHFEVTQTYGIKFDALVELAQSSPAPHEFPLLAEARKQQQLVIAEDVTQSGLVPAAYCRLLAPAEAGDGHAAETGKFCLVAAPLVAQGEAVGVIVLGFPPDAPSIDERRRALIAGIAQQAAVAIMAARLYAAQRDEAWITTALLQVAEAVASRNELPELLQLISRLTLMLAEVEHCGVYLWDSNGRRLVPTQATGFPPVMETRWKETPLTAANFPALTELRVASGPLVLNGRDGGGLGAGRLNEFFGERLVASGLQARGQFLGLMVVDLAPGVRRLSERDRAILSGIARQLSIAVENAQLYEEAIENERRTQELRLARQLQTALLPERPPVVPGYQLAGYWHPAREVAGDFYDYFFLSHNRLGIVIADVADKGMAAALFMVLARSAVRESVWSEEQAGAALTRANHLVEADARGGMFVTCFLGLLSPGEGRLVVSNAGHLPPLIYDSANDSFVSFALRNLPLG